MSPKIKSRSRDISGPFQINFKVLALMFVTFVEVLIPGPSGGLIGLHLIAHARHDVVQDVVTHVPAVGQEHDVTATVRLRPCKYNHTPINGHSNERAPY